MCLPFTCLLHSCCGIFTKFEVKSRSIISALSLLLNNNFKSGTKSYCSNYRGICISSCLGKLFCSILNQRLTEHIQSRDILHKSQIGFLANNWTTDHVLTLRTLIDKYVNCHKTKVYACFVDFKFLNEDMIVAVVIAI